MRVLLLGGTGLSGPFIAAELIRRGHDISVYHRGKHESELLPPCEHIHADRRNHEHFEATLSQYATDAVVDLFSMRAKDSEPVVSAFRGRIKASVHISSGDVYASLDGSEPISEDAPLREDPPYEGAFSDYDKRLMEETALKACQDGDFPATIIRYPVIYGPGKRGGYREWGLIKRALDGRSKLALPERSFSRPLLRGYAENLAHGVALALETENAIGKTYNLSDLHTLTLAQLSQEIAAILDHSWELVSIPDEEWDGYIYSGPEGCYDLTSAQSELGFEPPVGLREALIKTVLWQVKHPPDDTYPWNVAADQDAYDSEDQLIARM